MSPVDWVRALGLEVVLSVLPNDSTCNHMGLIRRIYAGLAWVYLICVVAQFALAGLGLPQLGGAGMAMHADFGYIALHLTPVLLITASLFGRVGRRLVWLTVTLAIVAFAQPIWASEFQGSWVAALHIVGAGVILVLSWQVARGATNAASVGRQPGPPARISQQSQAN